MVIVGHRVAGPCPRGRRLARGRARGSAYLIALAALVVGLVLGLALLAAASQAVRREGAQGRRQLLHDAAEGGLEYGYWAFNYGSGEGQPSELPLDMSTTLGGPRWRRRSPTIPWRSPTPFA